MFYAYMYIYIYTYCYINDNNDINISKQTIKRKNEEAAWGPGG